MQLPRRSVRSIQSLPSIYTAFPANYKPVRTHSASTGSESASSPSARSPDIEDGLEVVPLERDSVFSGPIVSADVGEKEVFISTQEALEKPLPSIPTSLWGRTWGRMSVKYRVFAVLGLQAVVLLTIGISLLATSSKPKDDSSEIRRTGGNVTNASSPTVIERGTFQVPIIVAQQQSSTCLARANESRAWQCAFDTTLQLSILPSLGDDTNKPVMMTLGLPSNSNKSIHCGQQAPEIGPTALTTVGSSEDGPQYHFSATYDRTVILRDDQLGQEKSGSPPAQGQPKHTTFVPGQSLWRCRFNDTRLEGFINARDGTGSNSTEARQLPYRLKLVEHRLASGRAPYCEKVVVGVDGSLEKGGEGVNLELAQAQSGTGGGQGDDRSCQCQWMVE